jgi:hypothetical protein
VYLQRELNGCAQASSARGPYSTPVRIDNRSANREPHTHAVGLGGVERVKHTVKTLRTKSRAGILHCDEHGARGLLSSADQQLPRPLGNAAHRLDGVEDQIENYLLELDSVYSNERQTLRELRLRRDAVLHQFGTGQGNDFQDDFVDLNIILPWRLFPDESTDPADDFTGALAVLDNTVERLPPANVQYGDKGKNLT